MKKGFTLVEMLAVITILGLIITIVAPKAIEAIEGSKNKSYNEQIERIKKAAELYATENSYSLVYVNDIATVYFQELIDSGYIDEPIYNPKTNDEFDYDSSYIEISNFDGGYAINVQIVVEENVPLPSGPYAISLVTPSYVAGGTLIPALTCDDCYVLADLDFSFPINGTSYSRIYISSNGFIAFDTTTAGRSNTPVSLTTISSSNPFIAIYMRDLLVNSNGGVYYTEGQENGLDYMLIDYRNVANYANSAAGTEGTFSIKLYSNGNVLMNFVDMYFYAGGPNNGNTATVGIYENSSAIFQYSFNAPSLPNNTAVLYAKS